MRPLDQLVERRVLKTELVLCDACNKLGTRFTGGIEKLSARLVRQKVLFILGREKCRLMVVKPPGKPLVGTVFEIDDGIFIAVKQLAVKCVARAMHRRRVGNVSLGAKVGAVKFCKDRGGRNAVETIAVIKYPKFHGC